MFVWPWQTNTTTFSPFVYCVRSAADLQTGLDQHALTGMGQEMARRRYHERERGGDRQAETHLCPRTYTAPYVIEASFGVYNYVCLLRM
jgi:hypothetical protein